MKRAYVGYKTIPTSQVAHIPPKKNGIYFASNQICKRATHSSILAWRIPWTEKPGGLQSEGSQGVRHDWATNTTTLPMKVLKVTQLWEDRIFQAPDWNESATGGPKKKKKKTQIKYLNSRWSHKIWDVMKSGEGSRENAQPKCRQRWTIRNGRRSRGQRGWGPLPDPCSMRCVQWVCPGVWWSNTGCCPPACTAVNQNLDSPVSHISLSSLGPRGDPLQKICMHLFLERASLVAQMVQNLPANAGDTSSIPGSGRSLEKGMAAHLSMLVCRIPQTGEPGRLQSMGLQELDTTERLTLSFLDKSF